MSPFSAYLYNFLTMGLVVPWIYVWAPEAFPGTSVWLACVFATLLELPIAAAVVWLATAMPRSGGDYVFQSRVLGGVIGFPVVMSGIVIWILQWIALGGLLFAILGLAPMLMGLGVHYQSSGLIDASIWVQSQAGVVIVSIAVIALMGLLLVTGLKNYVRFQWFIGFFVAVMIVIVIVQFLRTSPAEFAVAINRFSGVVDKNPDYYTWLQKDVADAGFNLFPKFALGATLLAAPILWSTVMWATYSAEMGGEIKGARVFKNQMFIIVGSLLTVGILYAVIGVVEQRSVGTGFFHAASASYYGGYSASGTGIGSVLPFPGVFAIVISPNPILTVLVGLGFMLASCQIICNSYIGPNRVIVAMSLDRLLPAWLSKVSPRFRTAVNAYVVYFILAVAWTVGYNYVSSWTTLTLGVTFAGGYVFSLSSLAAALVPFRAKAIYEASPGANLKIAGIPLVTILGLIGFGFSVAALIALVTVPAYGLTGTVPYLVVGGVVIACVVIYWIGRYYQKRRGIDVSYAFLEVPPE